jgi:heptosyltransferase-2
MDSMKIVVRAPNWVGDSILAFPAMTSLKNNFPDAEVWVAAQDWVKDLFSMNDTFAGVLPLAKHGGLKSIRESAKNIRDLRFDLGILFTNSFASALVFFLAKVPQRWGYNKDGRGLLLTKGVSVRPDKDRRHQAHYYLDLLSLLGMNEFPDEYLLPISQEERDRTAAWLAAQNIHKDKPFVILNPGAYYGSAKRWPPDRYAKLASLLQEKNQAQILIVGSEEETQLAETISSLTNKNLHILTGKTSLVQLAGLLSFANLFVTNDSGPMHMANFLKTPLVALFGPTEPIRTGPFQQPAVVVHKGAPCWPCSYRQCPFDHQCMLNISPEEVFQECQKLL